MMKLFGLLQRRRDLTLEQFSSHWSTVHRELALRLVAPGIMKGYVQNHREPVPVPDLDAPVDGSPELWIDGPHILQRLATAPEYLEGAWPDERNFMEGDSGAMVAGYRGFSGAVAPTTRGCGRPRTRGRCARDVRPRADRGATGCR